MNVLVVGAGIGGLVAALALKQDGHEVTIIEQQPSFKALSAALLLPAGTTNILASLGIDPSDRGIRVRGLKTTDECGNPLISPITPALSITRSSLHRSLVAALPKEIEVFFNAAVKRIRVNDDGATATWLDSTQQFDLIVGADSMNSSVRSRVLGPSPLTYSGRTAWRGIADHDLGTVAVDMWGPKSRVLMSPLPDGKTSYTIITLSPSRAASPRWPEGFDALTKDFCAPWTNVRATLKAPPPFHRDLYMMPKPSWGVPRVLLIGDAAHVMAPTLWQGASLAIEDGAAIALAARGTTGGEDTLKKYAAMRDGRVKTLSLLSKRIDDFQRVGAGLGRRMRNKMMGWVPNGFVKKQNELIDNPGTKIAQLLAENK